MTEIADDKSWWADVEHLRPGGEVARPAATTPSSRAAAAAVAERETRRDDGRPTEDADAGSRSGRITGRPLEARAAQEPPAVLRRADAAAFADAWDIDEDFSAPSRSREIVLERSHPVLERSHPVLERSRPAPEPELAADDADETPQDRRPTVRIGPSGLHGADLAERRPLRELEPRRPRSAVDRVGPRPDRIAMYVVLLGIALVLIAATTSSAGT